jgi:hypothetical protein
MTIVVKYGRKHNDPEHNGRGDYELINSENFKTSNSESRSYVRFKTLVSQPLIWFFR